MTVETIIEILKAYQRYVDYMNKHGFDDMIISITKSTNLLNSLLIKMRGHMGETYELEVYLSENTNELCIINPITNESVFDYLDFEEYEIKTDILNYFKFGTPYVKP